jgi:hypothetical protein
LSLFNVYVALSKHRSLHNPIVAGFQRWDISKSVRRGFDSGKRAFREFGLTTRICGEREGMKINYS